MSSAIWTLPLDGSTVPDKSLIGGKARSVAGMRGMGLPVPPAFVITTEACRAYLQDNALPAGLEAEIDAGLAWLADQAGRKLGDPRRPLLLSVRSGAAISMPGMMDTVLNLGMNDAAEAALAAESGDPDFARDTHRRFLELFAAIVLKTPVELARDQTPAAWHQAIAAGGRAVAETPHDCLTQAVRAVFESWNSRRARRYRDHHGIAHDLGTAVTIQAMVFGNLDDDSGTGVLFSRNPLTGERKPYGEYLPRAQGEDVVSGRFTPLPLEAMRDRVPQAHAELLAAAEQLETFNRDVQDIEFTVQHGKLYLLQARPAKRSPTAAAHLAVSMVDEGLINADEALERVSPEQISTLLMPRLAAEDYGAPLASGEGACPGAAQGVLVTDTDEAERRAQAGEDIVLLRTITSPEDLHGMIAARAIITVHGGSTSHAAVVSRVLGRPCVVGIGEGHGLNSGDLVTVDGGTGRVFAGALPLEVPDEGADPDLVRLAEWARARSPVAVFNPSEAPDAPDCVDVDTGLDDGDHDKLSALMRGSSVARGASLARPDIARLARDQGVRTIITRPVLPALLAVLAEAKA